MKTHIRLKGNLVFDNTQKEKVHEQLNIGTSKNQIFAASGYYLIVLLPHSNSQQIFRQIKSWILS